jgi:hypothetical protein
MGDLNDIWMADNVDDVMAYEINAALSSTLRSAWSRSVALTGDLTLTNADYPIQAFAPTAARTVYLPTGDNVNHVYVLFNNNSTYTITVKDSTDATIGTLLPKQWATFIPYDGDTWKMSDNWFTLAPVVTDTTAPGAAPTSLTNFLDMLANIVKTMTNAANWYSSAVRVLVRSLNLSDLADAPTARTNLGLGAANLPAFGGVAMPKVSNLTIASDAITVTGSHHMIDTEGAGASDNLATINGLTAGQWVILHTVSSARDVVIKHGTGNIKLNGKADKTLDVQADLFIGFAIDGSTVIGDVWDAG